MRKVGFLFLHHSHHVYHSAPIAFELSIAHPDIEVYLFTAAEKTADLLNSIGERYTGQAANIERITPPLSFKYFNYKRRSYPKPMPLMERDSARFNEMDVIVGTSFDTRLLRDQFGADHPKYVFTFHGAGDRAYGFQKSLSEYDLLLISGSKIEQRLAGMDIMQEGKWALTGYPKFDLLEKQSADHSALFENDLPTVLYNPHWSRKLSSWYSWGTQVLDYFAASTDYNLIFAPHLLLKEWKRRWVSLRKYSKYKNIHIDLDSPALLDMTYTQMADIYLGDVSSQVYEFLHTPRPCLFLNAHGTDWENDVNYLHWTLGDVVNDMGNFPSALDTALANHGDYHQTQTALFDETFDRTEIPAGKRAAAAIVNLMDSEK